MAHDVFISYSNRDSQIANAICHMLEEVRIKCWIAPRDIRPGEIWADEIATAIPKAEVLIVILSLNSNSSKQVLREIELAVHNNVVVLPVRIEDIMPTGGMSYYLSTTHWIDVIDEGIELKITAIINRIRNILDGPEYEETSQIESEPHKIVAKAAIKKPRKTKLQKPILAITAVVLLTAVGLTLFFMRDVIFNKQENVTIASSGITPSPNEDDSLDLIYDVTPGIEVTVMPTDSPEPTPIIWVPEDFGYDPDMEVSIPNVALKNVIIQTLEAQGNPINGHISVADMFHINEIYVVSEQNDYATKDIDDKNILENESAIVINKVINDLEGMQYAKNMRAFVYIDDYNKNSIENLSPLAELYNLEILYLPGFKIKNLDEISGLTNLWYLYLFHSPIDDISVLSDFEDMIYLSFPEAANLTDISIVAALPNIEELVIDYCTRIDDLSYLQNSAMIRNVKSLCLIGSGIDNIDFLSEAYNLIWLNVQYLDISDIKVLENLNLEVLWLSDYTYNNNTDTIDKLISNGSEIRLNMP